MRVRMHMHMHNVHTYGACVNARTHLQPNELLLARSSRLSGRAVIRPTIAFGGAAPPPAIRAIPCTRAMRAASVPRPQVLLLRRHLLLVHLHAKLSCGELIVAESRRSLRLELALTPSLLSKRGVALLSSTRGRDSSHFGEGQPTAPTLEGRVCPWRRCSSTLTGCTGRLSRRCGRREGM